MVYSWYIVEFQQWNKARRIENETKTKKMLFSINFHAELRKYEPHILNTTKNKKLH